VANHAAAVKTRNGQLAGTIELSSDPGIRDRQLPMAAIGTKRT
jgi:hypothetical protein